MVVGSRLNNRNVVVALEQVKQYTSIDMRVLAAV